MRSEESVTYAIWRVSNVRVPLLPAKLITTAPRIQIPLLFAPFIVIDTDNKSLVHRPICCATPMPLTHFCQPVLAMTGRDGARVHVSRSNPSAL